MAQRRRPLSWPRGPLSPWRKWQHQGVPGKSRLPWRALRPLSPRPPNLHPQVKVTRGGAGGRGRQRELLVCFILSPPSDVPSAPLLLTVEDVSDSSMTVSWEPPERPGRLGFQGYVLELLREGGELSPARTQEGVGLGHSRDKPPDPTIGQSGNSQGEPT